MDSRTHIVSTATKLFARDGFAGVSLRAIAERVGITKPSLLYHFPSKDDLRRGVLDNLFDHWATTLPRLLRAVTSGEGQFEALMHEMLSFFREDSDRARLLIRELLDRPDEMRARITETLAPLVTLIADYMRRGQASGELRHDVDPEAYILQVISMTISTVAAAPILAPVFDTDVESTIERHSSELFRIARASLFRTPPPARSAKRDRRKER